MNQVKTFSGIMSLDESNDIIGKSKHKEAKNGVFKGNAPEMHFTAIRGNQKISNTFLPINTCRLEGTAVYVPQCDLAGNAVYVPVCTLAGTSLYIGNTCDLSGSSVYIGNDIPTWTAQPLTSCYNCVNTVFYKDTNPYSPTANHYKINGTDVGLTSPVVGNCVTTANWVSQGYNTCDNCTTYLVYKDTTVCSPTYNHYKIGNTDIGLIAPPNGSCNTSPILTSQLYNTCFGCTTYTVYRNTNPCSGTYLQYYVGGEAQGMSAPANGACDTTAYWSAQGYTTCIGCTNYMVYRDLNFCSPTYYNYQVNGSNVGAVAPAGGSCNTAPIWVNDGTNTVCVGYDLHQRLIDSNPCSTGYGSNSVGPLIQANSASCGYAPTTFITFISTIDGASACAGGEYGQINATVMGTTLCDATQVITLPNAVWADFVTDQIFWMYKKTGGNFNNRKFQRNGSSNSATPIEACANC